MLLFQSNSLPVDFLELLFNIGFDGVGDVIPFVIPLPPVNSFGVVGGYSYGTASIVASGSSVAAAVPEPGTLVLAGLALAGLAVSRRRRPPKPHASAQ